MRGVSKKQSKLKDKELQLVSKLPLLRLAVDDLTLRVSNYVVLSSKHWDLSDPKDARLDPSISVPVVKACKARALCLVDQEDQILFRWSIYESSSGLFSYLLLKPGDVIALNGSDYVDVDKDSDIGKLFGRCVRLPIGSVNFWTPGLSQVKLPNGLAKPNVIDKMKAGLDTFTQEIVQLQKSVTSFKAQAQKFDQAFLPKLLCSECGFFGVLKHVDSELTAYMLCQCPTCGAEFSQMVDGSVSAGKPGVWHVRRPSMLDAWDAPWVYVPSSFLLSTWGHDSTVRIVQVKQTPWTTLKLGQPVQIWTHDKRWGGVVAGLQDHPNGRFVWIGLTKADPIANSSKPLAPMPVNNSTDYASLELKALDHAHVAAFHLNLHDTVNTAFPSMVFRCQFKVAAMIAFLEHYGIANASGQLLSVYSTGSNLSVMNSDGHAVDVKDLVTGFVQKHLMAEIKGCTDVFGLNFKVAICSKEVVRTALVALFAKFGSEPDIRVSVVPAY